jgi:hypothetical protein
LNLTVQHELILNAPPVPFLILHQLHTMVSSSK